MEVSGVAMNTRAASQECRNHDFEEIDRFEVTGAVGEAYMVTFQCQKSNCIYTVRRFVRGE